MGGYLGRIWRILGYLPIAALLVAGLAWLYVESGVDGGDVTLTIATFLNPVWYVESMLIHDGFTHFRGNMELFVPFAVVLTVLTSNRHVLSIVVVSHVLANVVWVATTLSPGIGTSGATFGVVAATLVRSSGYALENASSESLQAVVAGLLAPFLAGLFVITLIAGRSDVAHFAHFLAFLFGGAMEAMYVFSGHEEDGATGDRTISNRVGR